LTREGEGEGSPPPGWQPWWRLWWRPSSAEYCRAEHSAMYNRAEVSHHRTYSRAGCQWCRTVVNRDTKMPYMTQMFRTSKDIPDSASISGLRIIDLASVSCCRSHVVTQWRVYKSGCLPLSQTLSISTSFSFTFSTKNTFRVPCLVVT
jgi:hypothetical protein